jgi:hypothetical protein
MAVLAAYIVVGLTLLLPGSVSGATWLIDVSGAVALGMVVLLMTVTNTEHAPAAGTALGLSVDGAPAASVLFILTAAVLVALVRVVLKRYLHNLL